MGRAADEPRSAPRAVPDARAHAAPGAPQAARATRRACASGPATTSATSALTRACSARTSPSGTTDRAARAASTLGIEANGDIKGCPSLPTADYVGGNVRDASLRDIWERAAPLRFTRERTVDDLWGFCRTCYYAEALPRAAARGRRTSSSGGRATTPSATTARSSCCARESASASCARAPPEGSPFDYGRFEIVEEAWPPAEMPVLAALERSP